MQPFLLCLLLLVLSFATIYTIAALLITLWKRDD